MNFGLNEEKSKIYKSVFENHLALKEWKQKRVMLNKD